MTVQFSFTIKATSDSRKSELKCWIECTYSMSKCNNRSGEEEEEEKNDESIATTKDRKELWNEERVSASASASAERKKQRMGNEKIISNLSNCYCL